MIARLALLALAVTACSTEGGNASTPPGNAAAPETTAAVAAAPAQPVTPKPGVLKTFRDWTVGCDNGLTCEMGSLGPETADFPSVTVNVARAAGPSGGWTIELSGTDADPNAVAIDGKTIASGDDDYKDAQAAAIVAAMANGTKLVALDKAGKPLATISLAGAAAALRYIDAAQGRAGTVTAAVAKGAKPATAVPAAPALPVVAALNPGGTAATPTAAQLAEMRKIGECEDTMVGVADPDTAAIGGGATLVLVPCSTGAYNLSSALFILKDGKLSPATADVPSGFTEGGAINSPASVVNGGFDDGVLSSYAKGRGLGDCGVSQDFVWDGTRLRLVEQAEMGDCRGNTDLITTWKARVTRK